MKFVAAITHSAIAYRRITVQQLRRNTTDRGRRIRPDIWWLGRYERYGYEPNRDTWRKRYHEFATRWRKHGTWSSSPIACCNSWSRICILLYWIRRQRIL